MNIRNIGLLSVVAIVVALIGFASTSNTRNVEASHCLSNFTADVTGTTVELNWGYSLQTAVGEHCALTDFVIVRWNLEVSSRAQRIARVGNSKRSYADSGLEPNTAYVYRVKTKHTPPLRTQKIHITTGPVSDNPVPTPVPTPAPTAVPTPAPTPKPLLDPLMDGFDCPDPITDSSLGYSRGFFEKCRVVHNHGVHPVHEHHIVLGITLSGSGVPYQEARHYEHDGSATVLMSRFLDEYYEEPLPNGFKALKRNPNFHSHHKTGFNAQNLWNKAVFDQYTPGYPSPDNHPDSAFTCHHDSIDQRVHEHTNGECYHVIDGEE